MARATGAFNSFSASLLLLDIKVHAVFWRTCIVYGVW